MRLFINLASKMKNCLSVLLCLCLAYSSVTFADITLRGEMRIGDNDSNSINPNYLVYKNILGSEFQPVNPIHFTLNESFTLDKIELLKNVGTSFSIDAPLYFVIWKNGSIELSVRSYSDSQLAESVVINKSLSSGDYTMAVFGQCFIGSLPVGWYNNCYEYDDFQFSGINLVGSGRSNNQSFIQRRHIGDSSEGGSDAYDGRWYPNQYEDSKVAYEFDVTNNANLSNITIYNYRDLLTDSDNVKLTLSDEIAELQSIYLNSGSDSGNFVWTVNESLQPNIDYQLKVETLDNGDADDISWDDIVINIQPENTTPVNHYRILHNNIGATCSSTPITIQACSNSFSDNSRCTEVVNKTNVTFEADKIGGNNIVSTQLEFTGLISTSFNYTDIDPLRLSLTGIGSTPYYCNNGGTGSCDIEFDDNGLVFLYGDGGNLIANQVAGVEFANNPQQAQSLYLQGLYRQNRNNCKPLFKRQWVTVGLGVQCLDQDSCSDLRFKVDGDPIAQNNAAQVNYSYTDVDLYFNNKGVAEIPKPIFDDAGLIKLVASVDKYFDFNDVKGSSNAFPVRPYKFNIVATNGSEDLTQKVNTEFDYTHVAGDKFEFQVQAVNYGNDGSDGKVTLSYVPSSQIEAKITRSIPSSYGAEGEFNYAVGEVIETALNNATWKPMALGFIRGEANYSDATYSEVGAFKVNVRDSNYYGMSFAADGSLGSEIGRFIPAHFTLVSPDVTNYIETVDSNSNSYEYVFPHGKSPHDGSAYQLDYVANTRVLATDGNVYQCHSDVHTSRWCQHITESGYAPGVSLSWDDAWDLVGPAGSGITYMDQPELIFDYQLEARNAAEVVTQNYDGLDATVSFHALEGNTNLSSRLVDYTGSWLNGVYAPLADGVFSRGSEPDGPFSLLFGINVKDTDAVDANLVGIDMFDINGVEIAKSLSAEESELRYGRWFIYDGAGPTGSAFPVTMELQYYDSLTESFVVNTDDSITTLSASDAVSTLGDLTGSGTFENGSSQEINILSNSPGTAILKYVNAPEWLLPADGAEPSANIDFGFFYGNDRVIYRRRLN